ncbi:hypothetical protein [Sporosalibacterium faouarense]|uniref:hypothetical protein n=1 Tax=Sporosalibacterium faouarense TaxID=516123 RepID=UPI00192B98EE|nr:hypothetical protein [Sporosalibacterium faouarense]
MKPNMKKIEKDLEQLCIDIINLLDNLKAQGAITEEEYIKHTTAKRDFLQKINK